MYRHLLHQKNRLKLAAQPARRRAAFGAGLMALLCVHTAQAVDDCVLSGDINPTDIVHVVGEFESSSQQHDFLTDWVKISHPNAWSCTRKNEAATSKTKVIFKAYMLGIGGTEPVDHNFIVDGENYGVYRSGNAPNSERIGFIVTRQYHINASNGYSWSSPWLPVRRDTDNNAHPPGYEHELSLPNDTTYTVSFDYWIRLVKRPHDKATANDFPKTGQAIEFDAVAWSYYRAKGVLLQPYRHTRVRAWFNRKDNTCTTPVSQTVKMDAVPISLFKGIGQSPLPGTTPFKLALTDCSPSITGIDYKLAPASLHPNSHKPTLLETRRWHTIPHTGMLANTTGSATGVGVQVLDGNGSPVTFDTASKLTANTFTPGDTAIDIPLQARYIQTGNTVTPGTVHATMTVLYMYK